MAYYGPPPSKVGTLYPYPNTLYPYPKMNYDFEHVMRKARNPVKTDPVVPVAPSKVELTTAQQVQAMRERLAGIPGMQHKRGLRSSYDHSAFTRGTPLNVRAEGGRRRTHRHKKSHRKSRKHHRKSKN